MNLPSAVQTKVVSSREVSLRPDDNGSKFTVLSVVTQEEHR